MRSGRTYEVTPSAARLTRSLRDVGYDFPSAIADLVDNSISADAGHIQVIIEFDGTDSRVLIADDGVGMSENALVEALRFGSRRSYQDSDLGRYGLGLKTASLSQGRSVTVVTRRSASADRVFVRELDLDLVEELDEWLVVAPRRSPGIDRAQELLGDAPGTVVLWRALDRVLPERRPDGGWARRRLDSYARRTAEHLAVVFHRFIEGLPDGRRVTISVNGEKVEPWNPFAPDEEHRHELPAQRFDVTSGDHSGTVRLRRFVLPARPQFSSPEEFERLSGPLNWNRQQGLYVYRADRLVQWGGWAGIRGIDEHLKLARACLDFDTSTSTPRWTRPSTSTSRRCVSRCRPNSASCWLPRSTNCARLRTRPTGAPHPAATCHFTVAFDHPLPRPTVISPWLASLCGPPPCRQVTTRHSSPSSRSSDATPLR
ncbi:ATP-binding protein [Candidatus Frankia nodulisporulans]|uniref:ATP-binding protein n=1 Tax=Candidatus Frankia nodulisporulans TaxID=2060052 RepID=UPI001CDCB4C8|nr:ATP-binding protein [Candidatus Frankia nodulisporulans]